MIRTGSEGVLKQSDEEAYLWARRAANRGLEKAEYAVGSFARPLLFIFTLSECELDLDGMRTNRLLLGGRDWDEAGCRGSQEVVPQSSWCASSSFLKF